ncbi:MAG: histidine phosphatase family protein [Nocardioidaceae bacterium]|nr:histidine phosphatase family protein [Nocardioidaceae bacterium]
MSRRLVLLRHGRTAWNLEGRSQGHADVPLDQVGHAQAAGAAPVIAAMRPALLWSSDLQRARQTAEYVATATGLPVVVDPRLREFDMGERSGLTREEFAERFPDSFAAWLNDDDGRPAPGEQTRAELHDQLAPALHDHLAALGPDQTGVLVMHGASTKVAVAALLGWPLTLVPTLRGLDNCRWAMLEERPRDGRLRLAAYNVAAPPGPPRADFASDGAVG